MSNEIFNLEASEPISMLNSLQVGLKALFDNIIPFLKMCYFPFLNIFSILLMLSPIMLVKMNFGFMGLIMAGVLFVVGLGFFLVSFWKSLMGFVAVSYLAKDIYENKPIQEPSQYFSYVEKFSFSYLKFNLWLIFYGIFYSILFTAMVAAIVYLAMTFALIPFCALLVLILGFFYSGSVVFGLLFSYLFWAYGNKDCNTEIIKTAVVTSVKNFFGVFVLFVLLTSIIPGLLFFIVLLPVGFYAGFAALKPISTALCGVFSWFIYYATMFVATRYYFALINKK